jgi:methionyl-tRNA formyltransferase
VSATAAVFAYHDVGARCLRVLLDAGVAVRLVVTHRDDPAEAVFFESVAEAARARGLDVDTPDDPNAPSFVAGLRSLAPDFLFSFYYRRMLSPDVLATARRGAYNMHGSLLPRYRGRAPVNWAILKGERETGATLHEMVAKPDAGRIVDQQAVPIGENDLAIDVMRRVTDAAEVVLRRSLPRILDGSARPAAQDLAGGSYFGARRPEDGRIDWRRPAREIHDLVRAVAPPYPGAFAELEGRRVRILQTWWGDPPPGLPAEGAPGDVARQDGLAFVRCGDGRWLEMRRVEIMGESAP